MKTKAGNKVLTGRAAGVGNGNGKAGGRACTSSSAAKILGGGCAVDEGSHTCTAERRRRKQGSTTRFTETMTGTAVYSVVYGTWYFIGMFSGEGQSESVVR